MSAPRFEWPTMALLTGCYLVWALATVWLPQFSLGLAVIVLTLAIALFSSLQHELIHGHPFRNKTLNAALAFPSLTLFIPYLRFRDTHLAHHLDLILTDPYDDPESNYLDPAVWCRLSAPVQALLRFNNTLLGRLLVGPAIAQVVFMRGDLRLALQRDRAVIAGWLWHIPAVALVAWWLATVGTIPVWAYLLAAYLGHSILKIRTFLEHRAHDRASGRTVVIEDRGPLAFLFLNNNFHIVHHMHPGVPWYGLPKLYFGNRAHYLTRNDGYVFRSYAEIFRRYFWQAKDPVPHPLWHR